MQAETPNDQVDSLKKSILESDSSILPKKKIIKYQSHLPANQKEFIDRAKIKLMRSRSKDKEEKKVKTMT